MPPLNNNGLIKDLPDSICWKLAEELDGCQKPNWKTLISKMPKNSYDERAALKFHMAILKPRGSPTLELLTDLGRKKKTVDELITWLNALGDFSELVDCLKRGEEALRELKPSIERQPDAETFCPQGGRLTLSVEACGKAPLKYQWFKGNYELRDHTTSVLYLENMSVHDGGYYTCRVANGFDFIYTNWSKVQVVEASLSPAVNTHCAMNQSNSFQVNAFNQPLITMHPRSTRLEHGSTLHLYADAVGCPAPTLQWYHNNRPLLGECSREIIIPYVTDEHEGFYHLEAANKGCSNCSLKAQVIVTKAPPPPSPPSSKTHPPHYNSEQPFSPSSSTIDSKTSSLSQTTFINSSPSNMFQMRGPEDQNAEVGVSILPPNAPSEKIALVLGNQNYAHKDQLGRLVHPVNDAHDIAAELRSLDFKVVSLINLNLTDMRNAVKFFCNLLDSSTYALFYFAGHGFEIDGESYLMSVDATDKYSPSENLSLSEVIVPMTSKNPKLSVLLIDSCRTEPGLCRQDPILKSPHQNSLQRKNVTIGYGCCSRGRVLESPQMRNGFFAHHLLQNISDDVKIDDVLFHVSKGIHDDRIVDPATGRTQVVYRHTTVVDDLRLTDKTAGADAVTTNNNNQLLSWQHAHVAPESPVTVLENDHVTVQLVFTPEFSNCLLVQSKITEHSECESRSLIFFLPATIGGAQVETISPDQKEKKSIQLDDKIVRISNIERLEGDIDIHLEVTYEIGGVQHRQRAFYCIKEKPLYAKISDEMKSMKL